MWLSGLNDPQCSSAYVYQTMLQTPPSAGQTGDLHCARCQSAGTYKVRNEQLCGECLTKYVASKVIKRLEASKVRGGYGEARKKILIPISFGTSSIALLSVVDAHLQKRQGQSRHAGFSVHLLFIEHGFLLQPDCSSHLLAIQEKFPQYTLHTLRLEECFEYGVASDLLPSSCCHDKDRLGDRLKCVKQLLSSIDGQSSKVDILNILRHRLCIAFARSSGFDAVLFGDSTTRLAERTLAEAAKGRGGSVSLQHSDTKEPNGVSCIYPMRDLLRKELDLHVGITDLSSLVCRDEISAPTASSKDNSIDGLMRQYVESVEQQYPSVVANVVRTIAKLKVPQVSNYDSFCNMCLAPIRTQSAEFKQTEEKRQPSGSDQPSAVGPVLCPCCERSLATA